MSFLNPLFLFAMVTVAIPLLIYLLNIRKPKKVRFSTLAFFESLKSTSLKRIKLKRWLLLAMRCLAIIMLAVAASRPFLPPGFAWESGSAPKVMGILIDNSPTMQRLDRNGLFMDQALNLAADLVEMAESDDRILIERTNGESMNMPLQRQSQVKNRLADIEPLQAGNYLAERLFDMQARLNEAREPNKVIYLITDGQETQLHGLADENPAEVSGIHVQVMQLGEPESENTGFAGVEILPEAEDGRIQLQTTIQNYGSQTSQNQFLNVMIDNELISQQAIELGGGESEVFEIKLPATDGPFIPVELQIEGDEIAFDNRYFISVQIPKVRKVLVLEDPGINQMYSSYLKPVLQVIASENERFEFTFEAADGFESSRIGAFDAIVLDGVRQIPDYLSEELINHVQSGAGLLLLPAADGDINSYNKLLNIGGAGRYTNISGSYGSFSSIDRMAVPNEGHPVLETIFDAAEGEEVRLNVPEIFYYYNIISGGNKSAVDILQTATNNPLVSEVKAGSGRIIYSAVGSDPGWSNFPVKPFFAPFFFRTIDYLAGGNGARFRNHILGEPFATLAEQATEPVRIEKNGEVVVPDSRQTFRGTEILYSAEEWVPGWLKISAGNDSTIYSVNQSAMESQLNTLELENTKELLNNFFSNVDVIQADNNNTELLNRLETAAFGREVWYWFIIFAIILLLLETLISRFYKAESIA